MKPLEERKELINRDDAAMNQAHQMGSTLHFPKYLSGKEEGMPFFKQALFRLVLTQVSGLSFFFLF